MYEEKIEGIVLRSQDYQERHRLVTVYSPIGLFTLIVKNISKKNTHLLALTSVFTHAEYLVSQGNSPFFKFVDGTLIEEHLSLRTKLASIQTAALLTKTILSTQLPGKPTPELFALYKTYLKQVPTFTQPHTLFSSFQLKFLKQEGLLSLDSNCAYCPDTPATSLHQGESVCTFHAPFSSCHFNLEEWQQLHLLHSTKNFSTLRTLSILPSLPQKIETLFQSLLH